MVKVGLVILFEAKEQRWQCWPEFAANQVGLRAEREKTDFPEPPDYSPTPADSPPDDGEEAASGRQDDGEKTAEGEVKLSELKLSEIETPSAASAPSPTPKPKAKTSKPKTKTPEAVRVFRENAHRYPAKSWYTDIAEAVGEESSNLELWGQIVKAYIGCGWNPGNVKNMLEFYGRREIPATKGQHKANAPPHAGIHQWLKEQGVEAQ